MESLDRGQGVNWMGQTMEKVGEETEMGMETEGP